jgi:hypothetical protein
MVVEINNNSMIKIISIIMGLQATIKIKEEETVDTIKIITHKITMKITSNIIIKILTRTMIIIKMNYKMEIKMVNILIKNIKEKTKIKMMKNRIIF